MAKVKIIKPAIRLTNYQVGDEISLPDSLADELSQIGVVEIKGRGSALENATLSGPETATIHKSRSKNK